MVAPALPTALAVSVSAAKETHVEVLLYLSGGLWHGVKTLAI
jgi:hypothetical protein